MTAGAAHHILFDLSNLALHSPFQGTDEVIIGNDSTLRITHTGSTFLPLSSRPLSLHCVLYVPQMDAIFFMSANFALTTKFLSCLIIGLIR